MVYGGKPSRGCAVCRKRRIKCDEAVPSCSYCVKTSKQCPGYKSQFDVAWRDQNVVAEKSVQRRKKVMGKPALERAMAMQMTGLNSVLLSQDCEGYATNFFISSYLLLRKDPEAQGGFLDYLYPVLTQAPATSPLRPAVAAVASCLLIAWSHFRLDQALALTHAQYLRAIASLRQDLQGSGNVGDDVLMAALMLEMYENMRSFMNSKRNCSPHVSGITALVERRRRFPIKNELSQKIFLGARSQVVGKAMDDPTPVPSGISDLEDLARDVPKTTGLRLDDLLLEVANLHASATNLHSDTMACKDDVVGILKKAMDLEACLLVWKASVPDSWAINRVSGVECIPESVRNAGLYQSHCDIYHSVFVAITFNSYHGSRIKLQQLILTCLKHLNAESFKASCETSSEIIQDLADNICASVPYILGDRSIATRIDDSTIRFPHAAGKSVPHGHNIAAAAYGGGMLIRRLVDLISSPIYLRPGQRQWIGGQMRRIMVIYGICI